MLTPDIYDPALNPLYRDVLAHYGVVALPCRVRDPDRKGKVESGVGHAQKTPLQGLRFETLEAGAGVSRSLGDALGRHAHPRHDEAPGRRDVCRGAAGAAAAAASSRFATTATACAPCISTAASRSRPPTTARRPAGSASGSQVQWNDLHVRLLDADDRPAAARASCARRAAGTASPTRIGPRGRRPRRSRCCAGAPCRAAHRHASATTSTTTRARRRAPHPRRALAGEEARRRRAPTTPPRPRSSSGAPAIASSGATSNAGRPRRSRSRRSTRSSASSRSTAISSIAQTGDPT